MKTEVLTPEMQLERVGNVDSKRDFIALMDDYFNMSEGMSWGGELTTNAEISGRMDNEAFYKSLGILGILVAQYGFPSAGGLYGRHRRHSWNKPYLSPQHLLASVAYFGKINAQAYKIKEGFKNQMAALSMCAAKIQRLENYTLGVHDGRVVRENNTESQLQDWITGISRRYIFLQMPELYIALDAIEQQGATGATVDRLTPQQFQVQLLPQFVETIQQHCNVDVSTIYDK